MISVPVGIDRSGRKQTPANANGASAARRPLRVFSVARLAEFVELRGGCLFWRPRGNPQFDGKHAGRPVSLRSDSDGYLLLRICGTNIKAHRAIWALHHGEWPKGCIDHINRVKTDNRVQNLRDVSVATNNLNTERSKTGGGGVYWHAGHQRWQAQIRRAGEVLHLGTFATKEQALSARRAAEIAADGRGL